MALNPSSPPPVRLVVADDLRRSRLTVFFRLLLAVPHFVWLALWSVATLVVVIINWFATLFRGQSPGWAHRFLAAYLRYSTHLNAFLALAADPFPGFTGAPGSYPVDVEIDPPARQNRWKTGFRGLLVLPAALLAGAVGGSSLSVSTGGFSFSLGVSLLFAAALLGWWVGLFRARMPAGLEHAANYGLGYSAQLWAYSMLLTDRYPNSDPLLVPGPGPAPEHPVALRALDDGQRNRLTVFFRGLLAIPHIVWIYLWYLLAGLFALAQWFVIMFTRRPHTGIHRLIASFLRYQTMVSAYLLLLADPYPPFVPAETKTYPVDLDPIAPAAAQNRWKTFFRLPLALPASLLSSSYGLALLLVAVFTWWTVLFTGRMPTGLRRLGLASARYSVHLSAYVLLLTDRYPYSGPILEGVDEPRGALEPLLRPGAEPAAP